MKLEFWATGPAETTTGSVLISLAAVITVAFVFARLAQRLRQPAVMGEIVAGIALGPSLLGLFPGDLTERLFPTEVRPYLHVIAQLGLVLFMFGVGYQLDLSQLRGAGRRVVSVTLGSMLLPFGLGVGLAVALFSWTDRAQLRSDGMLGPALFMGVAISITAFPVLARILHERGMHRDPVGTMSLACAAVQDALAWCVLAAVAVAASTGGPWPLARMLLRSAVFVLVLVFVLRLLLVRLLAPRRHWCRGAPAALAVLVPGTLLCAWATEAIGLHAVFGAFAFGAAVPRRLLEAKAPEAPQQIEQISLLLLPAFFTLTGLSVHFGGLGWQGLVMVVGVLAVACVGKFGGAAGAAYLSGATGRQALALGVLLNARGLTELIVLDVGLGLGLIDTRMFTVMVVMAVLTTLMTGPLLERVYPRSRRNAAAPVPSLEPAGVAGREERPVPCREGVGGGPSDHSGGT